MVIFIVLAVWLVIAGGIIAAIVYSVSRAWRNVPTPEAGIKIPEVRPDEAKRDPYPYVFVENDGVVRELTLEERRYLETPFDPFDSGRPYIKIRLEQRNGMGKIEGFIKRANLP